MKTFDEHSAKLKKGDNVEIIDKNHVGFGEPKLKIIGITKHKHKPITLYEVENDINRYFCEKKQLKKI